MFRKLHSLLPPHGRLLVWDYTGPHRNQYGSRMWAAATAVNAALGLGGRPVIAERVSEADERERHRGISHHTTSVFQISLGVVTSADETGRDGWEEACLDLPLSHMGRGPDEDPAFFAAAYAAGVAARGLVR